MQITVKEAIQTREKVIYFLERQVSQLNNMNLESQVEDFEISYLLNLLKTER